MSLGRINISCPRCCSWEIVVVGMIGEMLTVKCNGCGFAAKQDKDLQTAIDNWNRGIWGRKRKLYVTRDPDWDLGFRVDVVDYVNVYKEKPNVGSFIDGKAACWTGNDGKSVSFEDAIKLELPIPLPGKLIELEVSEEVYETICD